MTSNSHSDWQWDFTWTSPGWFAWVVVCLLALVVVSLLRSKISKGRGIISLMLRLTALAALALALWPLGWTGYAESRGTVSVLLDDSKSMTWQDQVHAEMPDTVGSSAVPPTRSRWQAAKELLVDRPVELLSRLQPTYNVELQLLHPVANRAVAEWSADLAMAQPERATTPLGDRIIALVEERRGQAAHAILVLSDGRVNLGRSLADAASAAAQWHVPLHAIGLGGDIPFRDVGIERVVMDEYAFRGDRILAQVDLIAEGMAGETVTIEARNGSNQTLLDRQEFMLPLPTEDDGSTTSDREQGSQPPWKSSGQAVLLIPANDVGELLIEFSLATTEPSSGTSLIPLAVHALRRRQMVTVTDPAIHVLLIASEPTYEFRALREILSRRAEEPAAPASGQGGTETASGLQVQAVLFSAGTSISEIDRTTQATLPADWSNNVDVVLFVDVDPARFPDREQRELVNLVKSRGGGLAIVAGPQHVPDSYADRPLAALLPFPIADRVADTIGSSEPREPFRFMPTRIGWALGAMRIDDSTTIQESVWQRLSPLTWSHSIPDVLPGVRVIAAQQLGESIELADDLPLATLQFIGSGCVLFHATDESWRWRFRRSDTEFARYWQQMIRYLARGKLQTRSGIILRAIPSETRVDGPVHLQALFAAESSPPSGDQPLPVSVKHEDGTIQSYALGADELRRGLWTGTIPDLPAGEYVASVDHGTHTASCTFRVHRSDPELSDPRPDHEPLRAASRRTGGMFVTANRAADLVRYLNENATLQREPVSFQPLLRAWQIALIVCAALSADWLLRARWQRIDDWPDKRKV